MIKKLRIKFIIIAMCLITSIVIIGLISIGYYNYDKEFKSAEDKLELSIQRAANYVNSESNTYNYIYDYLYGNNSTNNNSDNSQDSSKNQQSDSTPSTDSPQIGSSSEHNATLPVATYVLTSTNKLVAAGAFSTAKISSESIAKVNNEVVNATSGTHESQNTGLIFKKENINNITYVAFSDIESVSGWKGLALSLARVGLAIIVLFFILIVFLSNFVVKPVKQAWDSQQRFVADASHDLKTPLAVIMANNSILQSSELGQNSSTKQWLDSTDQESNRMLELIDNMLNLARLDDPAKTREQVRKTFTRINFSEIVEEISLQFESVAFDKNAIFETDIEEDIYVFANVDNIRNTVGVLLENSCKYAQGKDVITIKLNSDNKKCTFSVKNKNSYISDEDLPHIFERFYRCSKSRSKIDNTNKDIKHGHGLGLAIAKATIEEADGTINVTSSSDGGTTFTTTLPLSK